MREHWNAGSTHGIALERPGFGEGRVSEDHCDFSHSSRFFDILLFSLDRPDKRRNASAKLETIASYDLGFLSRQLCFR